MLNQFILKFIKKELLSNAKMPEKIIKIDVIDSKNHSTISEIDLGIAAGANETLSGKRMEKLLHTLHENEWVNSTTADKAKIAV